MDVANVKNDSVVTLIPIRDILKDKQPGAYVLIAQRCRQGKQTDDSTGDDYRRARRAMGDRFRHRR